MPWQPKFKRHTPKCTAIAQQLEDCLNSNDYRKYFGQCKPIQNAMNACFNTEREEKRSEAHARSAERSKRVQLQQRQYREFVKNKREEQQKQEQQKSAT